MGRKELEKAFCKEEVGEVYSDKTEYSVCVAKPDAVRRGLIEVFKDSILNLGLEIIYSGEVQIDKMAARSMYLGTKGPFNVIVEYMSSGPSYAFIVRGTGAIRKLRELVGNTHLGKRKASGLRREFAINPIMNSIHASASHAEVVRDFRLLCGDAVEEILNFSQLGDEFYRFIHDKKGGNHR